MRWFRGAGVPARTLPEVAGECKLNPELDRVGARRGEPLLDSVKTCVEGRGAGGDAFRVKTFGVEKDRGSPLR